MIALLALRLAALPPAEYSDPEPAAAEAWVAPQTPVQSGTQPNPGGLGTANPPNRLPEPQQKYSQRLKVIRANYRAVGDEVTMDGGIECEYQGYKITADSGGGNTSTKVFDFVGNVRIVGEGTDVVGDHIRVFFKEKRYEFFDGKAVFSGKQLGPTFNGKLFVQGQSSNGTQQRFFFRGSTLTTCEYGHPHYQIDAADADVRPNKRVILRDLRLDVLGKHLISLPYLVLPLDEPNTKYFPEFGQNPFEGYFVKAKYSVPLSAGSVIYHLDYFSKIGNGFGFDYRAEKDQRTDYFRIYTIPTGPRELLLQFQNAFNWGRSRVDLFNDYSRNNHLLQVGASSLATRVGLSVPQKFGNTRLNYNRSENANSGFKFVQQSASFDDNRRIGPTNLTANLTWSKSAQSGQNVSAEANRQQMDVRLNASQDLKIAQAQLDYQRAIPIGSTGSFFSVSDRTPVLTLSSDSRRLFGVRSTSTPIVRTSFSFGEFADGNTRTNIRRSNFAFESNYSSDAAKRTSINLDGRFQQGLYSDGTAQFIGSYNAGFGYRLGPASSWSVRYSYLRPQGYSPLSFDRSGRTDFASTDLSFKLGRKWSFGGQTGYDFLQADQGNTAWQQLGLRGEYANGPDLFVRSLATYDTFQRSWSNLRIDSGYKHKELFVSLGSRYDVPRHTWGNVNLFAGGLRIGRSSFDARTEYNGYLKRFDNRQLAWVYDLHCWEAVIQYQDSAVGFRPGRTINLLFRLKAFPFDTLFGAGRNGNILGTGTGRDF